MYKRNKIISERAGSSDLLPEGVYGVTEDMITSRNKQTRRRTTTRPSGRGLKVEEQTDTKKRKLRVRSSQPKVEQQVKRKKLAVNYLPNLKINYESLELPKEASGLELTNAVPITEELLEYVKRRTEIRTNDLSHLLLKSITPSLLACDAALSYTKTFMESGFGFSVDADSSIQEALTELVRLETISFFIRRSKMLRSQKKRLLDELTIKTAEAVFSSVQKSSKSKDFSDKLAKLEAFVLHKSGAKTTLGPSGIEKYGPNDNIPTSDRDGSGEPLRRKTSQRLRERETDGGPRSNVSVRQRRD